MEEEKGRQKKRFKRSDAVEMYRPLTDIPQGLTKPKAGNEASLVLEFSYGNFDMLFTGMWKVRERNFLLKAMF
ncbi:hypothetical protein M5E84_06135 [[Ruminococcus] torques]|nr:hypothetical protein M5E84_06135 [[Ruminococcus] torques]